MKKSRKRAEPSPPESKHRKHWLKCRVNEAEKRKAEQTILALDPHSAAIYGQQIADRLTAAAPFPSVAAFLRCALSLEEIKPGAPTGNQNRRMAATKKAR